MPYSSSSAHKLVQISYSEKISCEREKKRKKKELKRKSHFPNFPYSFFPSVVIAYIVVVCQICRLEIFNRFPFADSHEDSDISFP